MPSDNGKVGSWKNVPAKMRAGMRNFQNGTSSKCRYALDMLPKELESIRKKVVQLRNVLEDATHQHHGSVSLTNSLIINSACRFETIASINAKALRDKWNSLSLDKIQSTQDRIMKATNSRDAAVEKLKLDHFDDSVLTIPSFQPDQQAKPTKGKQRAQAASDSAIDAQTVETPQNPENASQRL